MVAESSQIKLFLGTKKYDTFGGERGVLMHKHSPRLPGGGGKPKKSRLGPAYNKMGGPSRLIFLGSGGEHSTYLVVWMGVPVDFGDG